jgi:ABC-2 type transport system ATP-binding protein
VESGTLDELRHLHRTSINVELAAPPEGLEDLPGVHDVKIDRGHVRFDVDTKALDDALRYLTRFGVRSLVSQPPTLEELFLRHYEPQETAGVAR